MEAILPVAFLILCGVAFFSHRVCPKGIEYVALAFIAVGTLGIGVILFAPADYMLRIPGTLETILNPWILGLSALVLLILGFSGLIGSLAGRIVALNRNEKSPQK